MNGICQLVVTFIIQFNSAAIVGQGTGREMAIKIQRIGDLKNKLGEGPVWDSKEKLLYWVDSLAGVVHCYSPSQDTYLSWPVHQMIGSLALRDSGGAIVCLQDGFYGLDFDTGGLEPVQLLEEDEPRTRFNDGKVDRSGNFLAGSMGIKIRDIPLSALYRLNKDLSCDLLEPDVIVSNGPCFDPQGKVLYFNDGRRRILAYDYDAESVELANKRVLVDTAAMNTGTDGATVDQDGNIWVALIGSAAIGCFSPNGKLIRQVDMPVKLPSSVMFGGDELDILYVTSISDSGNRTSHEEGAGGLYQVTGLGVIGLPEGRFAG
jgi:sugar lactone lactonase YvrE